MWSMFYYYKKNYNYLKAINIIYLLVAKDVFLIFFYLLSQNKKKLNYRFYRFYGAISAILGLKSFKRP